MAARMGRRFAIPPADAYKGGATVANRRSFGALRP